MRPIAFEIEKRAGQLARAGRSACFARAGRLHTPHGVIETPAFVPVATRAAARAVTVDQLNEIGISVILGNTYHLYLQPGDEFIKKAGGVHRFMGWDGPMMTDSGGFQVFSLGAAFGTTISKITKGDQELLLPEKYQRDAEKPRLVKIERGGVMFRSHIDGSAHYLTPEKSIEVQHNLGADIIFAFDECVSPNETMHYQRESLDRTHRWARQCLAYHQSQENKDTQALFGIVQGGRHEELRRKSAVEIGAMEFDGFGIGGSFGKEDMTDVVRWVNEELPPERPRHLLGIGEPEDLFMGIELGVDTFDCVAPTRNARGGTLYTSSGKINILNERYRTALEPLDARCGCSVCRQYTSAYIAHLFRAREMLGPMLATMHNLYFIMHMVKNIRQSLFDDTFEAYRDEFFSRYST